MIGLNVLGYLWIIPLVIAIYFFAAAFFKRSEWREWLVLGIIVVLVYNIIRTFLGG